MKMCIFPGKILFFLQGIKKQYIFVRILVYWNIYGTYA